MKRGARIGNDGHMGKVLTDGPVHVPEPKYVTLQAFEAVE